MLLAVGTVLAALGGSNLWLGYAGRGWPTTEARVESSRVVTRPRRVDPEVRFVSDRVRIGGNHTPSGDDAARIVARHPVGSAVDVAYDPDHPESAVLGPGLDLRHAVVPLVGLAILAGVAFVAAARAVEMRKRHQTRSGDHAGHSGG